MKDDKGNGLVFNCDMAWAKPEFARDKVNCAGEILLSSLAD